MDIMGNVNSRIECITGYNIICAKMIERNRARICAYHCVGMNGQTDGRRVEEGVNNRNCNEVIIYIYHMILSSIEQTNSQATPWRRCASESELSKIEPMNECMNE